jgi:hypothetical protein
MTLLAKGCVMLMCPDLPIHLNTTTWALHLNPPARGLKSNKQTVSSFVMGFKYAARYRTLLLDAVSCGVQVVGAMTMRRQGLQRLATSPARACVVLPGNVMIQETHMCVLEALKANCSWWEICLSGAEVTNLGKFRDRYGS